MIPNIQNSSNKVLGSSLSLPAHGRAGARATPFLAAFLAKRKTKFGGGKARAGKNSGSAVFNEMIKRIEDGEANGILAWHPDRLARNSIDGGKIIYLIDTGKIVSLKFPTFWFDATPQGKFMLNIAFGQSKYYIDNLSENVKRGLRQKVRRGEQSGVAPTGYLNDKANHKIVPDPERFHSTLLETTSVSW